MRKLTLTEVLLAPVLILAASTLFGFLGRWHWLLDLFSHFRMQYALSLLLVAAGFLALKRRRLALASLLVAGMNAAMIAPLFVPVSQPPTSHKPHTLLLLNVETASESYVQIRQFLQQQEPDILVLEEINAEWVSELAPALAIYPHSRVEARPDNFGIGVWSKFPLTHSETRYLREAEVPTLVADLQTPSGAVTIIATHPVPPGGRENSRLRNEQLALLPNVVKRAAHPTLLVGDLNTTPWNTHFARLTAASGLRDSSRGFGYQATWPTSLPLFYIPLDHCLHSPTIGIHDRAVGPPVGSDHRPLIVRFNLPTSSNVQSEFSTP